MKKLITLFLALVMILSLCACGGSGDETKAPEGLQIGYAKVDITPDFDVGLNGYGNAATRRAEGLMTYVYITCIAATEGDETILLYTIDSISCDHEIAEFLRGSVSATTGVAKDKIFIGATHDHSAPNQWEAEYKSLLGAAAITSAKKALEDRSPATIQAAMPTIEGMNFVRHYKMQDGSYAGSNFGDYSIGIVDHVAEPDKQMVLVKFDRADDKKDVLLVNWQAHPDHSTSLGFNMIAADFVGPMRDELEKLSGMQVAYFTGASGNLNPMSKITEENHGLDWKNYGIKLGQLANAALPELKAVEGTGIATTGEMFQVNVDHSWDHMLTQAQEVQNLRTSTGSVGGTTKELALSYGFSSAYQAGAIISRAGMGQTIDLELNAFRIGGIGFATTTNEMFCQTGQFIKENDPFEVTFIISGNSTYLPVEEAYDYRSYEADTSLYAKGSAEKIGDELVRLLGTVK